MSAIRVLLIEDNAMNRQVVRDMFAVADMQIDEAASGAEGLQKIDRHRYDVLLVDLRMPGIDGFEVMRQVRSRLDDRSTTPIIVISGEVGPHLRTDCLTAGADDVLAKPVAMQQLFESIGVVLGRRAKLDGLIT